MNATRHVKSKAQILPQEFYARGTVAVALDLLGKVLESRTRAGVASGRIVEVEAYLEGDPASHSTMRRSPRREVIWGPAGRAYVYLNYGMYCCLNVVAEAVGTPGCVLIRALEPLAGIALMQAQRHRQELKDLASGPGKLTQALQIGLQHNGADLTRGDLMIRDDGMEIPEVVITSRIGISKAVEAPLRFFVKDNSFVSQRNRSKPSFIGNKAEALKLALKNWNLQD
jgi:DNA-3-methyladenine glycosylase